MEKGGIHMVEMKEGILGREKERDDAGASLKDLLLIFNRRAENAAPPAAEEGGKQ